MSSVDFIPSSVGTPEEQYFAEVKQDGKFSCKAQSSVHSKHLGKEGFD